MVILDANIILRYLLNDNAEMANIAEAFIKAGNATVTIEILAEVVYVLKGVYSLQREQIANTITQFLELVECRDYDIAVAALQAYSKVNLDFVDCVLYAYHRLLGVEIATFDLKLKKMIAKD